MCRPMQLIARYVLPALMALSTLFVVPACDQGGAEREAVRDVMEKYYNSDDGATIVTLVTNSTLKWYDRMLALGRDGTAQQIANLSPTEKWEILMLRNRNTKA